MLRGLTLIYHSQIYHPQKGVPLELPLSDSSLGVVSSLDLQAADLPLSALYLTSVVPSEVPPEMYYHAQRTDFGNEVLP